MFRFSLFCWRRGGRRRFAVCGASSLIRSRLLYVYCRRGSDVWRVPLGRRAPLGSLLAELLHLGLQLLDLLAALFELLLQCHVAFLLARQQLPEGV